MNKKLFEFLSTQFKNGEPKLWGSFHIISLVISLTIAIIYWMFKTILCR